MTVVLIESNPDYVSLISTYFHSAMPQVSLESYADVNAFVNSHASTSIALAILGNFDEASPTLLTQATLLRTVAPHAPILFFVDSPVIPRAIRELTGSTFASKGDFEIFKGLASRLLNHDEASS